MLVSCSLSAFIGVKLCLGLCCTIKVESRNTLSHCQKKSHGHGRGSNCDRCDHCDHWNAPISTEISIVINVCDPDRKDNHK